jgi:hypothetical protein
MHPLAKKNKYVGFLFMKLTKEYFALGKKGIKEVTLSHVKSLTKYSPNLDHILCTGLDARYDQITMMEADTLEEIYDAAMDFKFGGKSQYIEIVDVAVGIKAPPRSEAGPSKLNEE